MDSLINIGTDEKAVKEAKDAILEIMSQRADQSTIQIALRSLVESIQPRDTVISNCNFTNNEKENRVTAKRAKAIGEKMKKSRKRGGD